MDKDSQAIQNKIQNELKLYKAAQKDLSKLIMQRQLLDGQLNENKSVMEELNLMNPENKVYKLYGPVLVRQELEECRSNVGKRMEFINKEIKRCQTQITNLEKEQDKHHENLQKFQQAYQVAIALK